MATKKSVRKPSQRTKATAKAGSATKRPAMGGVKKVKSATRRPRSRSSAKRRAPAKAKRALRKLKRDVKRGLGDVKSELRKVKRKVSDASGAAVAATHRAAVRAGKAVNKGKRSAVRAAHVAGDALTDAAGKAKRTVKTVSTTVLDQNKDGKVDQTDIKILTEKGVHGVSTFVDELAESEGVRNAAKAAAVGALVALPLPVIGPAGGAAIGALGSGVVSAVKSLADAEAPRTKKRRSRKSPTKKGA
jgi:hypothetical protein